jgi:hypothetical protein
MRIVRGEERVRICAANVSLRATARGGTFFKESSEALGLRHRIIEPELLRVFHNLGLQFVSKGD